MRLSETLYGRSFCVTHGVTHTSNGGNMGAQVEAIQAKSESWNVRLIAHHDLNGHGDGMQLLKHGRYIYLAHLGTSPMALSIFDVSDPADPKSCGRCRMRPIPTRTKCRSPAIS